MNSEQKAEYINNYEKAQKETLIKLYAKIIWNGSLYFLSNKNGNYEMSVYTYRLDKKNKTAYCTFWEKRTLTAEDIINNNLNNIPQNYWMTASEFQKQKNLEVFNYFSDDFLELSNDDKINVLNNISKRNK